MKKFYKYILKYLQFTYYIIQKVIEYIKRKKNMKKEWIKIKEKALEDAAPVKKVKKSGLQSIMGLELDSTCLLYTSPSPRDRS